MHRRPHILLALTWYHPKIHRGVVRYAGEAGWHLNASMVQNRVPPKGWKGDGVITTAGPVAVGQKKPRRDAGWRGIRVPDDVAILGVRNEEMDETYVGGEKPGKRGRGALGKILVGVAVQDKGKQGIGRIRMGVVPDASQETLGNFANQTVEPTTYRQMVRHVRGPKTSKHATTQNASCEGRNRWTTTATTTDNERNPEFVHRSRRRSRPPSRNPGQLPKHNI